ncbi:DUF397 domain-containing protein [Saccharopolyspora sp. K220]|uniref:DUF397 domain-containing protein n=1 Tax=Saccharopolyspora soli TaxID=2926618 RepID=UPI001F5AC835|nr:DUF397 domain-containing protein [Saccharopolyspora soli]MCI2417960.1 DUF397 domain-containing protein [Saccharopolyspora soli]
MNSASPTASGWFKSSYSSPSQNCVEIQFADGAVRIRDSKDRGNGPIIGVPRAEWDAFVSGVRDGEFDLPRTARPAA